FGRHAAKLAITARVGVETELSTGALPIAACDWVVDATGSPEGLRSAAAMTRPRGTVILKLTVHGTVPVDTAPIIVNELTLVGSRCGRVAAALPLLGPPPPRAAVPPALLLHPRPLVRCGAQRGVAVFSFDAGAAGEVDAPGADQGEF